MIAAWAVYGIALAALLALAARAAEETLSAWGMPTRWVWTAAAAGPVLAPLVQRWDLAGRAFRRAGELLGGGPAEAAGAASLEGVAAAAGGAPRPPGGWPEALHFPAVADQALVIAWAVGSALVLAGALRAWWRVRRGRRSWPAERIDGVEVLVSSGTGPAVSGLLDPVIVVPRRVLRLPARERRLVVRHEREHRRAGDPIHLAVGLAALVACPWNPVLWWTVRRLRLAVERDCDRRVLDGGADPETYGSVLLAEAGGRPTPLPSAALGRGRSHLERRIRAMAAAPARFRALRSATAIVVTAGVLVVACDTPTPPPGASSGGPDADAAEVAASATPPGSDAPSGSGSAIRSDTLTIRGHTIRADTFRLERMGDVEVEPPPGRADGAGPGGRDARGARSVRIRGDGALDLSSRPLIIVDGERPEDGAALSDLDPAEIESIEVVKGATAVELYGEAAADGVVRIVTRDAEDGG